MHTTQKACTRTHTQGRLLPRNLWNTMKMHPHTMVHSTRWFMLNRYSAKWLFAVRWRYYFFPFVSHFVSNMNTCLILACKVQVSVFESTTSALLLLQMLSSLRTPCLSCRPSSQTGTLNSMTCLLLLPHFVKAMQSPCNGFHPTAPCLATRLLTL